MSDAGPPRPLTGTVAAEAWQDRHDDVARRLAGATDASERAALREAIAALYREADAASQAWTAAREQARLLAGQWKALGAAQPAVSRRIDHLGATTHLDKGWSRLSLGDAQGAEAALRQALDLSPGHPEGRALLAWALALQSRAHEARDVLAALEAEAPDHALAGTVRALLALHDGRLDEAEAWSAAVAAASHDRRATMFSLLFLGRARVGRGSLVDAEAALTQALTLGPNFGEAWYELGRVRWLLGRREEARDAWRRGAAAGKFSPWGKRCSDATESMAHGHDPVLFTG